VLFRSRIAGKYYLIFEKINGTGDVDRVDADKIMVLFRERGFPSQLVKFRKKDGSLQWAIWGLHGFENPKGTAAKKYQDGIKRVGKEYFGKYGKYEFQNPGFIRKP